ncbi:Uncharacterised protein [Serratia fonticola]|nr:Uncharacterised protein [Serratia fonticola]
MEFRDKGIGNFHTNILHWLTIIITYGFTHIMDVIR